jgi:fructokinase
MNIHRQDQPSPKHTVVGLGEILWDLFEDASVFGGAPANFACHAAGLGMRAIIKSAIGQDDLGSKAVQWLRQRSMPTDYVAVDPEHATGTVQVRLNAAGTATYEFAPDVAWDHLACDLHDLRLAQECRAVCFGTLAQRSPVSRAAIDQFLDAVHPESWRILDVNLRQNFFSPAVIRESVQRSNAIKLNDEEWPVVSAVLDAPTELSRHSVEALAARNKLRCVALTHGARGSWIWLDGQWDEQSPEPIHAVDTVGAGDAFIAALISGLLRSEALPTLHERASRIAAYVCTQRGATPMLPENITA